LRDHARIVRVYRDIATGRQPGPKESTGDGRSPVGQYTVVTRSVTGADGPALGLSYPNATDAERAYRAGRIDRATYERLAEAAAEGSRPDWETPLGGGLLIRGEAGAGDTDGSFALTPRQMAELYRAVPIGTPVWVVER
jgi:murein L,D-transpeptidase YafK